MTEERTAATATAPRGPSIAASALLTVVLLAAGVVGLREASPTGSTPRGYQAFLNRTGEPVVLVETNGKAPPMTVTVTATGRHGTAAALPSDTAQLLEMAAGGAYEANPDLQVERSFSTQVSPDGSILATTILTLLKPDGYATAVIAGSNVTPVVYLPPRMELPAQADPGVNWTGDGSVNAVSPYRYRGEIGSAESRDGRGCIKVQTTLEQQIIHSRPYSRTTFSTWCAGLGVVEETNAQSGLRFQVAVPGSVSFVPPRTPAAEPIPLGKTLPSPFLLSHLSLPPIVMGGLLMMTNGASGDLHAVHPTAAGQEVVWVHHPGGEVLGMATDESLLFVATTNRRLMAFDAAGRIHWLTRLPDAAVGSPAYAGDLVTVALMDGTVRAYDRNSGEQRWSTRLDDTISVSAVASAGQIVSADVSGLVLGVRLDGTRAWSASVGAVRSPITPLPDGSVLVADEEAILHAFDSNGVERWATQLQAGVVGAGATLGDTAVLPVESGIIGIDPADGSTAWHIETPEPAAIATTGAVVAGSMTGRVTVGGQLLDREDMSSGAGADPQQAWPVVMGGQDLLVDATGAVTAIGDA